ncbi:MAG: hypothetical protein ACI92I_000639 [Acidimicrobiales bacterium]|jgi:hypothetical protein
MKKLVLAAAAAALMTGSAVSAGPEEAVEGLVVETVFSPVAWWVGIDRQPNAVCGVAAAGGGLVYIPLAVLNNFVVRMADDPNEWVPVVARC